MEYETIELLRKINLERLSNGDPGWCDDIPYGGAFSRCRHILTKLFEELFDKPYHGGFFFKLPDIERKALIKYIEIILKASKV